MKACGDGIVELIEGVIGRDVRHAVVLLRHSAREYHPDKHDLDNPPKTHTLRAYASPPARCMETAELILLEHSRHGGEATRHRPVEALGVFSQHLWLSSSWTSGFHMT